MFKLQPADVLVTVVDGSDLYSIARRCAGVDYGHVYMFLGKLGITAPLRQPRVLTVPMIFESIGRGVVLRSLSERYGEKVVVMRLKSGHDRIPRILEEAIKLASEPQAYYDYLCIVKYILPRLICEKLGLPVPLKYQRNPWHVCSEGVYEVFYRAKLVDILAPGVVPLPGDFLDSPLLEGDWEGYLSEELV